MHSIELHADVACNVPPTYHSWFCPILTTFLMVPNVLDGFVRSGVTPSLSRCSRGRWCSSRTRSVIDRKLSSRLRWPRRSCRFVIGVTLATSLHGQGKLVRDCSVVLVLLADLSDNTLRTVTHCSPMLCQRSGSRPLFFGRPRTESVVVVVFLSQSCGLVLVVVCIGMFCR